MFLELQSAKKYRVPLVSIILTPKPRSSRELLFTEHKYTMPLQQCFDKSSNMLHLYKAILLFVALFAGQVISANSCRQCWGKQTIEYKNRVTQQDATNFFTASLGDCATGADYRIDAVAPSDCLQGKCKKWVFTLWIWRYCGNGPSNYVNKGAHCIGSVCAVSDERGLTCHHSVQCKWDCDCLECQC